MHLLQEFIQPDMTWHFLQQVKQQSVSHGPGHSCGGPTCILLKIKELFAINLIYVLHRGRTSVGPCEVHQSFFRWVTHTVSVLTAGALSDLTGTFFSEEQLLGKAQR